MLRNALRNAFRPRWLVLAGVTAAAATPVLATGGGAATDPLPAWVAGPMESRHH